MKFPVLTLLLMLFVTGCMVGPNYVRPQFETPTSFVETTGPAEPLGQHTPAPQAEVAWWSVFDDPLLVTLIERAAEHNHDLRVARARVREARALRGVAAGRLEPRVGAAIGAESTRASGKGLGAAQLADVGLIDLENDLYQIGFDAAWEIDVFGGNRRAVQAADARLGAAEENRREVLLSVIAEVARNYIELRGNQRRREVAQKNIRIQTKSLELVRTKYRVGLAPELDVARASALLDSSRARVPPLEAGIRAGAYRISVLTGRLPAALLDEFETSKALPVVPDAVPLGVPSELLRRRPDLRSAERRLAAATADVGVATADLFPKFVISGGLGLESTSTSSLLDPSARFGSIGGGLFAPLFQGGRIRANIEAARARNEAEFVGYEQAVLLAVEEVETALSRFNEQQAERRELAAAVRSSERAVELARILYDKGLAPYLDVLDAERSLSEIEDRLASSETLVVTGMVRLYKTLGGGWEVFEPSGGAIASAPAR